ncbi:hypothetical protein M5K25_008439 [Dendrobium thyrsiflorum]|uniref:Uncharacterized protein n=1 Tax=Dendrobium thyrsiflorum TaxID=117978 RepID=A0ABD0V8P5_DENTH
MHFPLAKLDKREDGGSKRELVTKIAVNENWISADTGPWWYHGQNPCNYVHKKLWWVIPIPVTSNISELARNDMQETQSKTEQAKDGAGGGGLPAGYGRWLVAEAADWEDSINVIVHRLVRPEIHVEERRSKDVRSSLLVEHKSVINVRITHALLAVEMKEGGEVAAVASGGGVLRMVREVMMDTIKILWFRRSGPSWSLVHFVKGGSRPNLTEGSLLVAMGTSSKFEAIEEHTCSDYDLNLVIPFGGKTTRRHFYLHECEGGGDEEASHVKLQETVQGDVRGLGVEKLQPLLFLSSNRIRSKAIAGWRRRRSQATTIEASRRFQRLSEVFSGISARILGILR